MKARCESSPQALHHFTRFDQVNQLVAASEANPDMGFMARLLALCSLPRTNPGDRAQYVRRNGPYTLVMVAGGLNKLPFGNLPRLLLAWVCTEAVRTRSRVIVPGPSLAKFMKALGVYNSGGQPQARLCDQMKRLFGCTVTLIYKEENVERFVNSPIAESGEYWWSPGAKTSLPGWNSKIELGDKFFNEIIKQPVPLNMNILTALKRSTLGLDLYLWLVYRSFALRAPKRLTWRQMYRQFGAHPANANDRFTVHAFRYKVLRELKKIKLAWPELNYATAPGALILLPSMPTIAPLNQGQLTSQSSLSWPLSHPSADFPPRVGYWHPPAPPNRQKT